jgi:ADP-ribose pyrophosphatase YjhB (NUDIX family)
MTDPDWLTWTREMQAIAQTGLHFTKDPYDRERYEQLRALASRIMAAHTATPAARIESLFAGEQGYATPKLDVRGAVFNDAGEILLVREAADDGRWTLPGGWADINLTPAENVLKEIREESGYEARVVKLAALFDRTRQGHGPLGFSVAKALFICAVTGGAPATSLETLGTGWFAKDNLPADLSEGRTKRSQILRMFDHAADPGLATDFE